MEKADNVILCIYGDYIYIYITRHCIQKLFGYLRTNWGSNLILNVLKRLKTSTSSWDMFDT